MDTSRVQAYLKVACAGLGFDVGEVWVTTKSQGSAGIAFGGKFNLIFRSFDIIGKQKGRNRHKCRSLRMFYMLACYTM